MGEVGGEEEVGGGVGSCIEVCFCVVFDVIVDEEIAGVFFVEWVGVGLWDVVIL